MDKVWQRLPIEICADKHNVYSGGDLGHYATWIAGYCKLCMYGVMLHLGNFCEHGFDYTKKCKWCDQKYPGYFGG